MASDQAIRDIVLALNQPVSQATDAPMASLAGQPTTDDLIQRAHAILAGPHPEPESWLGHLMRSIRN